MLMKVNVHEIEVHKEVRFTFSEGQEHFGIEDSRVARIEGEISGDLTFSEARGVILGKGVITFEVSIMCSRCLEFEKIKINREFQRIYEQQLPRKDLPEEAELTHGDLDVVEFTGDEIMFNDDIRDEVLLSIPEFFFCSVECQGLCEVCGKNLNKNPDHKCKGRGLQETWQKELKKLYGEIKGGNNGGS